nr:ribonuclease H-like domain-containing protein [Tanacetum cinerariifolium]
MGHTVIPRQETTLPHAFTVGTLHGPATGAWNMDTGVSSHLNASVTNLNDVFNTCIYPPDSVVTGILFLSIAIFVRDNNCTIEFDEFGFSIKHFITRWLLLQCDSTGALYPVMVPSSIPHAFLQGETSRTLSCLPAWQKHVRLHFVSSYTVVTAWGYYSLGCVDFTHSESLEFQILYRVSESLFTCDRGGEFDNRNLHKLFADNVIQFRFSCPKTSQQNGKSERMTIGFYEPFGVYVTLTSIILANLNLAPRPSSSCISLHFLDDSPDIIPQSIPIISPQTASSNNIPLDNILETTNPTPVIRDVAQPPTTPQPAVAHYDQAQPPTLPHLPIVARPHNTTQDHQDPSQNHTPAAHNQGSTTITLSNPAVQTNNPNPASVHPMVTHFRVRTNRPPQRLNLHVSSVSPLPKYYHDAFSDPNWQNAMRDEYNALIKNRTWILVPRPTDTNIVRCMWLFIYKYLADGTLGRYKVRLVENGSTQLEGADIGRFISLMSRMLSYMSLYGLKQAPRDSRVGF